MYNIRTAAKALIINNNEILLIKHKSKAVFYTLPGGGQDHNENLSDTLERECFEELGAKVAVKDVAFVFEYIAENHDNKFHLKGYHQLDVCFKCDLVEGPNMARATETDGTQIGFEWVSVDQLLEVSLYPLGAREQIVKLHNEEETIIYLGDIK